MGGLSVDRIRFADLVQNAPRQRLDASALFGPDLKNRKLIPAKSRNRIEFPDTLLKALRHYTQQFIARRMSQRVIDELEAIKIDQQQCETLPLPSLPPQRCFDVAAQ